MVHCEECRKKLGISHGYKHPALGKRFPVCSNCFDIVSGNMDKWSKFCLSDSYNAESRKIYLREEWNKSLSNDIHMQKWFSGLWIKIENTKFGRRGDKTL